MRLSEDHVQEISHFRSLGYATKKGSLTGAAISIFMREHGVYLKNNPEKGHTPAKAPPELEIQKKLQEYTARETQIRSLTHELDKMVEVHQSKTKIDFRLALGL